MWLHTVERRLWPSFFKSTREVTASEASEGAVDGKESPEVDADVDPKFTLR